MEIIAIIEKNENNYYQISSDDELQGCCFGGYGYSVAEAKEDFYKSIQEAKEIITERGDEIPKEAEDIKVSFRYDIPALFNYFDWINVSQFAKRAGVNESKMRQYKAGLAYASETTTKKILKTLQDLSKELQTATL
ncbi:pilus assembly protein HicB [Parabacteroides sp. W1-Q-101]|uniref:pilus assembly protein HicB n=1 Tax=Parabacteroides caeci TaxID=2949650 RepID=UPI00202F7A58|nr:pilus assembly protein HicB [Parabacteroides sp. W1-Q-101]MCM0717372.1 pilus assembly protein HicB [Parabacteroides sp. W1-Q-101]